MFGELIKMKLIILASVAFLVVPAVGHAHSKEVTKSSMEMFVSACTKGDGNSCQALGDVLRDSKKARKAGVKVDLDRALEFYEKGCKLGDTGACGSVNRIFGDPKYKGYDPARALPYFIERCEKRGSGSSDCRKVKKLKKDV